MYNLINNSFLLSPLEQFQLVVVAEFHKYYQLSRELGAIERQSIDLVGYVFDFYDEYLITYTPTQLIVGWLVIYFAIAFTAHSVFNIHIGIFEFTWAFEYLGHYVMYFFFKALQYFAGFIGFTLIATPVTAKEICMVIYYTYLIKVVNIIYLDYTIYFAIAFGWLYFFELRGEYFTQIGIPFILPMNGYYYLLELFHRYTIDLLSSITAKEKRTQRSYPIVYLLFFFLLVLNVQGLIPYMYTITAHLSDTFYMALAVFAYIFYVIIEEQGVNFFFSLFLPSGTPLPLAFLLVPIEVVSYFFRVISLSVRLFANMMAGHTLLKVILGFSWSILSGGEVYYIINFVPIIILMLLTSLELGVAIIQAYIFSILTCIYLKDAFAGH